MDGVLIEAKEWHYEALNKALNLFGYNISRYDHIVTYDGLPTSTKLQMLTREQQHVLALRFSEERSVEETARLMDKTVGAVKTLQYRAIAGLRQRLRGERNGKGKNRRS